jgi:hypothetical protein
MVGSVGGCWIFPLQGAGGISVLERHFFRSSAYRFDRSLDIEE